MEFFSPNVRRCAALFQTVSFGDARQAVVDLLAANPPESERIEALSLLLRINIERDETEQFEEMTRLATEMIEPALASGLSAALYHLGIVGLLAEDTLAAELCFSKVEGPEAAYGLAAVKHKRRESDVALQILTRARKGPLDDDWQCLMALLQGNCLKGLGKVDEAFAVYQEAQQRLPLVRTFYLKHWVLYGLATAHARRGENATATTLFEVLLSITHPVDFRRLHRLVCAELSRVCASVEVLLDPITGDIACGTGYLSLRRKPILISLLSVLVRAWPEGLGKEEIYRRVWGGEYHPLRHDGLMYSHMQRLRQILSGDSRLKDFILTTQDGYRLNPEIRVKLKEDSHETHSNAGSRRANELPVSGG